MEPELSPVDLPLAPSWLDDALAAVGMPMASITIPTVVACALLSMGLVDAVKGYVARPDGVDSARWQWGWRVVVILLGALLGALSSALGQVSLAQGLYLGLAGGVAAPVVWHLAVQRLRRGVR
jgi:hypothetical protein